MLPPPPMPPSVPPRHRALRNASRRVALTLIALGMLGFVPLTTPPDLLYTVDGRSDAALFGIIHATVLLNALHLGTGLVGIILSRTIDSARVFLASGGVVYVLAFAYRLVDGHDGARDWMLLVVGCVMIAVVAGVGCPKQHGHMATSDQSHEDRAP